MCLFMCYECMHAYRGQKRASKAFTAEVKANLGPLEDQEEGNLIPKLSYPSNSS